MAFGHQRSQPVEIVPMRRRIPPAVGLLTEPLLIGRAGNAAFLSYAQESVRRFNWTTWGNETSLNCYIHCRHVICGALLHRAKGELLGPPTTAGTSAGTFSLVTLQNGPIGGTYLIGQVVIDLAAGDTVSFANLAVGGNASGSDITDSAITNSILVVPEPSAALLFGVGSLLVFRANTRGRR